MAERKRALETPEEDASKRHASELPKDEKAARPTRAAAEAASKAFATTQATKVDPKRASTDALRTSGGASPLPPPAPAPTAPAPLPPSPMAGFTGTVASRAQSPVTYSRKPPAAAARADPLLLKPAATAVASPVMANGSAAAIAALNSANAVLQRVAALPKAEERKVDGIVPAAVAAPTAAKPPAVGTAAATPIVASIAALPAAPPSHVAAPTVVATPAPQADGVVLVPPPLVLKGAPVLAAAAAAIAARTRVFQEALASPQLSDVLNSIVNDFIDEAVLGSVLEVHRGLKQAQLCLNCDPIFADPNASSMDVFSQPIKGPSAPVSFNCIHCDRPVSTQRYAAHLEKCMGMGRNSSRVARARLSNLNAQGDRTSARDVADLSSAIDSGPAVQSNGPKENIELSASVDSEFGAPEQDERDGTWSAVPSRRGKAASGAKNKGKRARTQDEG